MTLSLLLWISCHCYIAVEHINTNTHARARTHTHKQTNTHTQTPHHPPEWFKPYQMSLLPFQSSDAVSRTPSSHFSVYSSRQLLQVTHTQLTVEKNHTRTVNIQDSGLMGSSLRKHNESCCNPEKQGRKGDRKRKKNIWQNEWKSDRSELHTIHTTVAELLLKRSSKRESSSDPDILQHKFYCGGVTPEDTRRGPIGLQLHNSSNVWNNTEVQVQDL